MIIFAIILLVISLIAVASLIVDGRSPIVAFTFLVFFTLYLMGIGK